MASAVDRQVGIAVVGCGYWGPNHIRNLVSNPRSRVLYACDLDQDRLDHIAELYPVPCLTRSYEQVLADPDVEAIVLATPVSTHTPLARAAFAAGKHVLIEKPMTTTLAEAEELVAQAEAVGRILMVGHTFIYAPAVQMIKETIDQGVLGNLYYVSMQRLNLGLFQTDINVVQDLAPHDFSILLHVIDSRPVAVATHGRANVHPEIEDVAMTTIRFESGLVAYLHFSWLDPKKVRRSVFVGDRKMLVYDDIRDSEKVEIYDKGVSAPLHYDTFAEFKFSYRYGEKVTPYIHEEEPLKTESNHFLDCILSGRQPRTAGAQGVEVMRLLHACQRSLDQGGRFVDLDEPA